MSVEALPASDEVLAHTFHSAIGWVSTQAQGLPEGLAAVTACMDIDTPAGIETITFTADAEHPNDVMVAHPGREVFTVDAAMFLMGADGLA